MSSSIEWFDTIRAIEVSGPGEMNLGPQEGSEGSKGAGGEIAVRSEVHSEMGNGANSA